MELFEIDTRSIKRLETDLKNISEKALPYATRYTLTTAAANARVIAQNNIKQNMTLRNKFTERSIRFTRAEGLNISQQKSSVGSIAPYMEYQEFGKTLRSDGKHGRPITTSYATGEGENAVPRKKALSLRSPHRINNIKLSDRKKSKSRKQRNAIAISEAAKNGSKYTFLDFGETKGIFKVVGGKKKPRIKMLHDLSNRSIQIKRTPWLKPAFDEAKSMIPEIYEKSLKFQLQRLGF